MNRKLKALGLALSMALMLSTVAVSTASAHKFKGGTEPTYLSAVSGGHHIFEAVTGEHKPVICGQVNVTGTVTKTAAETLTVEPTYSECSTYQTKAGGKTTATADTEKVSTATVVSTGCHYTFSGTTTKGNPTSEVQEHANVEIFDKSGSCNGIEFKVTALGLKCITAPIQTIKHAAKYTNTVTITREDLIIEATAHGIETTTTGVCGEEKTHTNGGYTGSATVTGWEDSARTAFTNVTIE
jgi:hypothetical protein